MRLEIDLITGAVTEHEDAPATEVSIREQVLRNIQQLETSITPRRLRDAILTGEGAQWLSDVENEIAIERAKL